MSDTASVAIVPRVHILSLFAAIISSWWHALPVLVLLVGLPMQLAAIIISLVTGFRPPADPTTIFTSPAFYLVLFGMFTSKAALAGLGAIIVIRRRLQVVSQGPRLLWYLKRLPLAVAVGAAYSLLCMTGLVALIVPGIYIIVVFALAVTASAAENLSFRDAFRFSKWLLHYNSLRGLVVIFVTTIAVLVAQDLVEALLFPAVSSTARGVASWIVGAVIDCLHPAMLGVLYLDLRAQATTDWSRLIQVLRGDTVTAPNPAA